MIAEIEIEEPLPGLERPKPEKKWEPMQMRLGIDKIDLTDTKVSYKIQKDGLKQQLEILEFLDRGDDDLGYDILVSPGRNSA